MQIKTDGLVIRELNVGESDRIITILTREKGVVRASARRARIIKSRLSTATQLLSHSEFTLFQGREKYIIDEAETLNVFMGLRKELDRLALAQYLAELGGMIAPQEGPAEIYLRLLLNAYHLIETGKRQPALVKAAVEMRMLTVAGFMPDLVACRDCGRYETDHMFFEPRTASLVCGDCLGSQGGRAGLFLLFPGALAAMRHTVYAEFDRLFSFSLSGVALAQLAQASEAYLLHTLERGFATLDFYNSIKETL